MEVLGDAVFANEKLYFNKNAPGLDFSVFYFGCPVCDEKPGGSGEL